MAKQPVKIFELSGEDWMAGISPQVSAAIGGLFQSASNFYPFRRMGEFAGTDQESAKASGVIVKDTKYRVKINPGGGIGSILYFGFVSGDPVAYEFNASAETATDKSSDINAGMAELRGAGVFKDKVLYSSEDTIWANTKNLTLAQETTIVSSGLVSGEERMFKVGPDRNCYFTNGQYVGKITDVTGTSGNDAQFFTFGDGVKTKDLESDSQHLVIIGNDEADDTQSQVDQRCFVSFWNMKSADLTRYWEFNDNRLYAIQRLGNGGEFLVFGERNIYLCSISQYPIPIIPKTGNFSFNVAGLPTGPHAVDSREGCVIWVDSNGAVWGYGSPILGMRRILFQISSSVIGDSGLTVSSASTNRIYVSHENTSSRGGVFEVYGGNGDQTSILRVSHIVMDRPYRVSYAKVIIYGQLESGDSVDISISAGQGSNSLILNPTTKSFSADGQRSELIYYPTTQSSIRHRFNMIDNLQISNIGARIKKFELWAEPLDPKQAMD